MLHQLSSRLLGATRLVVRNERRSLCLLTPTASISRGPAPSSPPPPSSAHTRWACPPARPLPPARRGRGLSTAPPPRSPEGGDSDDDRAVTFVQLRELLKAGEAYVVDVREPWELAEYGGIPGALNIPLLQLEDSLSLTPAEFQRRYHCLPPSRSGESLVFSCLAGIRSLHALQTATRLGYSRAVHYPGGWEEWSKKEKK